MDRKIDLNNTFFRNHNCTADIEKAYKLLADWERDPRDIILGAACIYTGHIAPILSEHE